MTDSDDSILHDFSDQTLKVSMYDGAAEKRTMDYHGHRYMVKFGYHLDSSKLDSSRTSYANIPVNEFIGSMPCLRQTPAFSSRPPIPVCRPSCPACTIPQWPGTGRDRPCDAHRPHLAGTSTGQFPVSPGTRPPACIVWAWIHPYRRRHRPWAIHHMQTVRMSTYPLTPYALSSAIFGTA